jgi:hypothetical protein
MFDGIKRNRRSRYVSSMLDFSEIMTVMQLRDLVVFLETRTLPR